MRSVVKCKNAYEGTNDYGIGKDKLVWAKVWIMTGVVTKLFINTSISDNTRVITLQTSWI